MKTLKPFEGIVGGLIERESLTTSLHIANVCEKLHKNVLQSIDKLKEEDPEIFSELNIQPAKYKDLQGEMRKVYRLNRDACFFIVMGMTGKPANIFKKQFIDAFNAMEEFISSRLQGSANHKLMMVAKDKYLTSIGRVPTRYDYSSEASLINLVSTGSPNRFGRDTFTTQETELVEKLEEENMMMILLGIDINERKKKLIKLRDEINERNYN